MCRDPEHRPWCGTGTGSRSAWRVEPGRTEERPDSSREGAARHRRERLPRPSPGRAPRPASPPGRPPRCHISEGAEEVFMPVEQRQRRSVSDRVAAYVGATKWGGRASRVSDELHHRPVPNHWTNLFGVVTVACVVVLFVTGIVLMFFYTPSNEVVRYEGSYSPLHGAEVSKAFASTMGVSFDAPGGLIVRQAHHWAALLLPAVVILQMLSIFFTGGFRRPRRGAWVVLFLVFVSALAAGWSGYALPDDMLSGTGLRIVQGIILGIPFIGTDISFLLFGGDFPGSVLANLYPLHLAVSVALLALLLLRGRLWYRQPSPQFAGPGRTETRVVGAPFLPNAAR